MKYQNIGRTHGHTDTHTQTDRVKTIPCNPIQGRGKNAPINFIFDVATNLLWREVPIDFGKNLASNMATGGHFLKNFKTIKLRIDLKL